jgi:CheY-like chemotaxis protein
MTPSENASIMVVDDEPANLKLLEDMLKVREAGWHWRLLSRIRLICFCSTSICRK